MKRATVSLGIEKASQVMKRLGDNGGDLTFWKELEERRRRERGTMKKNARLERLERQGR